MRWFSQEKGALRWVDKEKALRYVLPNRHQLLEVVSKARLSKIFGVSSTPLLIRYVIFLKKSIVLTISY